MCANAFTILSELLIEPFIKLHDLLALKEEVSSSRFHIPLKNFRGDKESVPLKFEHMTEINYNSYFKGGRESIEWIAPPATAISAAVYFIDKYHLSSTLATYHSTAVLVLVIAAPITLYSYGSKIIKWIQEIPRAKNAKNLSTEPSPFDNRSKVDFGRVHTTWEQNHLTINNKRHCHRNGTSGILLSIELSNGFFPFNFAYTVQDWAWDYPREHPECLVD